MKTVSLVFFTSSIFHMMEDMQKEKEVILLSIRRRRKRQFEKDHISDVEKTLGGSQSSCSAPF